MDEYKKCILHIIFMKKLKKRFKFLLDNDVNLNINIKEKYGGEALYDGL